MDQQQNLQDLVRCHICETPHPSLHCQVNHVYFSDETKEHKVIPFQWRGCFTKCQKHSKKICERFCEQCNIPVCEQCESCPWHVCHEFVDLMKKFESIKNVIKRDLQELDEHIYPKYQEIALYNEDQVADLNRNAKELKTAINKHGEDLQKEIVTAIENLKSNLDEMDSKHFDVLKKQENEIKHNFSEIKHCIDEMNKLLISNDVRLVSAYKSRNAEFRRLPPKLKVSLPSFTPQKINKEQLYHQLGSLSAISIKTEEQVYSGPGVDASPPMRLFIDKPLIIEDINTEYRNCRALRSVSCLSDDQIWACGYDDNILRLYNLQGDILKSIQTRSENNPWDIAVTRSGDLVYTDKVDRTVSMIKDAQIRTVIRLKGWIPRNICLTSSADLLVVMVKGEGIKDKLKDDGDLDEDDIVDENEDDNDEEEVERFPATEDKHTKVVRFSGSKEKQSIQYDDRENPIYSSDDYSKYICENRNLDICVADSTARAVVVVNQAGKLRFTYNGSPFSTRRSLYPRGITTDSQGRILIADHCSHYSESINIVDQDGQFLRHIDNFTEFRLYGLCVDTKDNLFVVVNGSSRKSNITCKHDTCIWVTILCIL